MEKKFLGIIAVVLLLIGGGGYMWYNSEYGGTEYYVQIHEDGKVEKLKANNGDTVTRYNYSITGYDSKGNSQVLNMGESHNLRHDAYLKVLNNKKKGVLSWEEVQKKDVPEKALDKVEQE